MYITDLYGRHINRWKYYTPILNPNNKWHKAIKIIQEGEKCMLKFKNNKKDKKVLNIGVVLDRSSSMSHIRKEAINSLNSQLASFREEASKTGIETFITINTFHTYVDQSLVVNVPVQDTSDIDIESYHMGNTTALCDAVADMIFRLDPRPGLKLMLVITDGQENASVSWNANTLSNLIKSKLGTDLWTLAFAMPHGGKDYAIKLGIPEGCITEWEATYRGVNNLTKSIRSANTQTFAAYSTGSTCTRSYFAPDLNGLNTNIISNTLDDVTNNFSVHNVSNKVMISKFVTNVTNRQYSIGSAYYQLTKKETVQSFKDVLILDKRTNRIYGGNHARSLLRIPMNGEITLNPASSPDYDIFIRSTSWNRNLFPNTKLLIKTL